MGVCVCGGGCPRIDNGSTSTRRPWRQEAQRRNGSSATIAEKQAEPRVYCPLDGEAVEIADFHCGLVKEPSRGAAALVRPPNEGDVANLPRHRTRNGGLKRPQLSKVPVGKQLIGIPTASR